MDNDKTDIKVEAYGKGSVDCFPPFFMPKNRRQQGRKNTTLLQYNFFLDCNIKNFIFN
jgi:hypothetical protein